MSDNLANYDAPEMFPFKDFDRRRKCLDIMITLCILCFSERDGTGMFQDFSHFEYVHIINHCTYIQFAGH